MNDDLHSRVRQRLETLGMTPEAASKASGFDRNFLRKMFERDGSMPRSQNLVKLARTLKVPPQWLLDGGSEPGPEREPAPHSAKTIPVFGLAAGATAGASVMAPEPVEFITAPPALATVRGAYALICKGTSMEPRFFAGDILYVHPHRPVRSGDFVIVQIRADHVQVETWVKRYRGEDKDMLVTEQYNPPATIRFKRATVGALHRILTVNELFGI